MIRSVGTAVFMRGVSEDSDYLVESEKLPMTRMRLVIVRCFFESAISAQSAIFQFFVQRCRKPTLLFATCATTA
jgi:hypothetical protein